MKTMFEMPDDSVAKLQSLALEKVVVVNIQRENLAVFNEIARLPAKTATSFERANQFFNQRLLLRQVIPQRGSLFVFLAQVVRGRSDDQRKEIRWERFRAFKSVIADRHEPFIFGKHFRNMNSLVEKAADHFSN